MEFDLFEPEACPADHVFNIPRMKGPRWEEALACFEVAFDVSDFLHPGANAIGVTLGRGYFSGVAQEGFNLGFAPWRNEPRLLLQLDVTYRDGQTARVVTDGAWQMADGPIRDSLTFGEHYDARLEQPGWTMPSRNIVSAAGRVPDLRPAGR
jgi:hypothetical protein